MSNRARIVPFRNASDGSRSSRDGRSRRAEVSGGSRAVHGPGPNTSRESRKSYGYRDSRESRASRIYGEPRESGASRAYNEPCESRAHGEHREARESRPSRSSVFHGGYGAKPYDSRYADSSFDPLGEGRISSSRGFSPRFGSARLSSSRSADASGGVRCGNTASGLGEDAFDSRYADSSFDPLAEGRGGGAVRIGRGAFSGSGNRDAYGTANSRRSASAHRGADGDDLAGMSSRSRRAMTSPSAPDDRERARLERRVARAANRPAQQQARLRQRNFTEDYLERETRALREEEGTRDSQPDEPTFVDKLVKARRAKAKEKAGKQFTRAYGDSDSTASENGPRAALYEGQMGRNHKRSTQQMGAQAASGRSSKGTRRSRGIRGKLKMVGGAVAAVVLICAFLYSPVQMYYQELRENARLQLEYEAVTARNDTIRHEVDVLSSDIGIENRARAELGWVKPGEHAVVVSGITVEDELSFVPNVVSEEVKPPETWYSGVLDPLFGVE